MASTRRLLPNGDCWFRFSTEKAIGALILPVHDKATESAVILDKFGSVQRVNAGTKVR